MPSYDNIKSKIASINYKLLSTEEEFNKTRNVVFSCENEHIKTLNEGSFVNQFSKHNPPEKNLCADCNNERITRETNNKLSEKLEQWGCVFIKREGRDVYYICHCGSVAKTNDSAITRIKDDRVKDCSKCSQIKNRKDVNDIILIFEKEGCKLLTTSLSYKDNKHLHFECSCKNEGIISLNDFIRGRRCGKCKLERTIATNQKNHQVDNVSQIEENKQKSIETNLIKRGVKHHMHTIDSFTKMVESSPNVKNYMLPSGKIIKILGDENLYLDFIFGKKQSKYFKFDKKEERDIDFNKIQIQYINEYGEQAFYYPDFHIPAENKIIEVKSTSTIGNSDDCRFSFVKNIKKFETASKKYKMEVWIFHVDKIVAIIYYNEKKIHTINGIFDYNNELIEYKNGELKMKKININENVEIPLNNSQIMDELEEKHNIELKRMDNDTVEYKCKECDYTHLISIKTCKNVLSLINSGVRKYFCGNCNRINNKTVDNKYEKICETLGQKLVSRDGQILTVANKNGTEEKIRGAKLIEQKKANDINYQEILKEKECDFVSKQNSTKNIFYNCKFGKKHITTISNIENIETECTICCKKTYVDSEDLKQFFVEDLYNICRNYEIKGFSTLSKDNLIEHIVQYFENKKEVKPLLQEDLIKLTVKELKEICKEINVKNYGNVRNKQKVIDMLIEKSNE